VSFISEKMANTCKLSMKGFLYICILIQASACKFEKSGNQELRSSSQSERDTIQIEKYSVKEKLAPELADWQSFEVGKEVISTPQGWTLSNKDNSTVLLPPTDTTGIEKITFDRYYQDSPNLDLDLFVQNLYKNRFSAYKSTSIGEMKKVEFKYGLGYERQLSTRVHNQLYTCYFLVFEKDKYLYEYTIIMSSRRLSDYRGDLIKDIASNLIVKGEYIFS